MTERKLPFECRVLDKEPVEIANRFTGEKVTIPPDAVAVYDGIMGAELFKDYDMMRKGLDWFITNEPAAYMILLDWTEASMNELITFIIWLIIYLEIFGWMK